MRIIAGTSKGRKLIAPSGLSTRPTAGKVREALFNILRDSIADAHVLDLFAGTGAFGLEAISRGAASGVFVDSDKKAVETIRRNVSACRADHLAQVICWNIVRNLHCLDRIGRSFDLVFMDPPYNKNAVSPTIQNLINTQTLAPGATLVIEHGPGEPVPDDISGIEITDRRNYGKTSATFLNFTLKNKI